MPRRRPLLESQVRAAARNLVTHSEAAGWLVLPGVLASVAIRDMVSHRLAMVVALLPQQDQALRVLSDLRTGPVSDSAAFDTNSQLA